MSNTKKPNPTKKVAQSTYTIPDLVSAKMLFMSPNEKRHYLLDGLLPRGILAALVGTSDVGKSMFARDFALHLVLNRKSFIGKQINTKYNKVLYVSTEDDKQEWRLRLKNSICELHEGEKLDGLSILFSQGKDTQGKILSYLQQDKADLVVIDVACDLGIGDINNTDVVRNFLNPYKEMARQFNTTILFLHHTGKRTQGIDKDNTIGSQAWVSTPRAVWMLNKESSSFGRTPVRMLTLVKGNFAKEEDKNQPIPLLLKEDGLTFEPAPLSTSLCTYFETGKKQRKTEDPDVISRVMELSEEGLTILEIVEKLHGTDLAVKKTSVSKIIQENKKKNGSKAETVAA
jgi:hypothetical protein